MDNKRIADRRTLRGIEARMEAFARAGPRNESGRVNFREATRKRATLRVGTLSEARRTTEIPASGRQASTMPLILHARQHEALQPVQVDSNATPSAMP